MIPNLIQMIRVGILLTSKYKLLSVAAVVDVLETANNLYKENGDLQPYQLSLLTLGEKTNNHFHGYDTQSIYQDDCYDLIFIPAFTADDIKIAVKENLTFIPWVNKQYQYGAEIASVCTGAFLLAATGLLDGKVATTHVNSCTIFANTYPSVSLKADKTFTQDGRLYTSGGATSSFHLLLHILENHCGKDIAIKTAKIFAIDMDRPNQSYFSSFQPTRHHHDNLVALAQEKIEAQYQDVATIEEMIKDIPSSRRNIVRRFKQVTGITPIAYLQQTRIEAAKKLLEQTAQQMTEVIYNSGYNDPKSFRKMFRKSVGMTPTQYRYKFQVR